jgi:homogentisate 1,2-dioxygenase
VPYYRVVGEVPAKRHTQFRRPDGGLYAEELMGAEGFSGPSALLYHREPPTAIVAAEPWTPPAGSLEPNLPLLPRHFRTHKLDAGPADVVNGRQLLLGNDEVRIAYAVADRDSPLYRNAAGDECVYVESGRAVVETVFGCMAVAAGDYVVIPRATTHRWVVTEPPVRALVLEAAGHVRPPARYLSAAGQFLEQAPYCERDLRGPDDPLLGEGSDVEVLVRHRGGGTRYAYATHPFDVVGWDGCLYPFAFNIADFEPVVGRVHLPPPVHQTFEGPGFVVCSFCPRPFDFDPLAIPAPYNHANVDSDEVLFYVGGDFMSRKGAGIEHGSVTLHPSGFIHGPQPGSVEASIGRPGTDESAVMVDTFRPLGLGPAAMASEDDGYRWTWAGGGDR